MHEASGSRLGYITVLKNLIRLVWRVSPWFLAGLFLLTLLNGLAPLAGILISSALLDALVQFLTASQPPATLPSQVVLLLALMAGANLLAQLVGRLRSGLERLYQVRVKNYVSLLIAEKAASLDLAFFENPEFHNLLSNASGEASYRPLVIVSQFMTAASALTTMVSVAVVLLLWQPWIVPIIVLAALLNFRVAARFSGAHANMVIGRTALERKSQYLNALLTADWVAKEVRLFGLRDFLLSRVRDMFAKLYLQDRDLARREVIHSSAVDVLLVVVQPLLFGFTAFQVLLRTISLGQFNLYTKSIDQLHFGLYNLMFTLAQLHENNIFVVNLFRFLDLQPGVEGPRANGTALAGPIASTPRLEFRNVSFGYPDTDEPAIQDLSFQIAPGQAVALVGENGAGKTTLVKLLAGLYQPTAGQILLDGVDIQTLSREALRAYLGVIFQDYSIYHFSTYDNIAVGRVDQIHDRARVEDAARRSGLDHVIRGLSQGYDTVLGRFIERGHELSGGQRQLVALTRALMRAAPILVLDEPTAVLDIHNEQRFFRDLLDEHRVGCQSVIFISHRFSTVRRADRILVLEHGRLVEQGPHEALMALRGRYAEMFNLQVQMYGDPALPAALPADELAPAADGLPTAIPSVSAYGTEVTVLD